MRFRGGHHFWWWARLGRNASRSEYSSKGSSKSHARFISDVQNGSTASRSWKKIALGTTAVVGAIGALTSVFVLWNDLHPIRRAQEWMINSLVDALSGQNGATLQEQSIRILSSASRRRSTALGLMDRGCLDALASLLDQSGESPWLQRMILDIIANFSSHDPTRVLAHARVIGHLRNLSSSCDRLTAANLARLYSAVLCNTVDPTAAQTLIRLVRISAILDVFLRSDTETEIVHLLRGPLARSLAQMSISESPVKYEDEPFDFILLLLLLADGAPNIDKANVARALANSLAHERVGSGPVAETTAAAAAAASGSTEALVVVDSAVVVTAQSVLQQEYLAEMLFLLYKLKQREEVVEDSFWTTHEEEARAAADLQAQIARSIANLAVVGGPQMKKLLIEHHWNQDLLAWATDSTASERQRVAAAAGLANLSSIFLPSTDQLKQLLLSQTTGKIETRFAQQILRLCLAASVFHTEEMIEAGFVDPIWKLASGHPAEISGAARTLAFATLAAFVKAGGVADRILSESGPWGHFWPFLIETARHDGDPGVRREAVRIIANLSLTDSKRVKAKGGVESVLKDCLSSETDPMVIREVIRAQASLASSALKGQARYDEGIFLLYPQPDRNSSSKSTSDNVEPAVDIVFIHGVGGHALGTWRGGKSYDENISWPRDWIPTDFPNSRVITVAYEVYLSRWEGSAVPLKLQSVVLLKKLKLANIGSRPIIFVAHSFGGLIVKDMLRYAANTKEFKSVRDSTLGVFFFSSPHRGSRLTELTHLIGGYADTLYRSTPAIADLKPTNQYLKDLNDEFCSYAPSVTTFSTGEEESCTLTANNTKYMCFQVVSDESAVLNPCGPCTGTHRFLKLPYDHRGVCKPETAEDLRYQLVVNFIREQLAWKDAKLLAAATAAAATK